TDMELSLRTSIDAPDATEGSVVVPGRLLLDLARLLPAAEVTIEHKPEEAAVEIRSGSASYRLHTYNAEDFPRLPEAEAAELLEVVRRVSVMAQRNSPLRLRFADGELTVSAQTQDVGEARESLPVPFSGEPLEIGFNAEFLRDGIESVLGDQLRLKLISPLR